MNTQNNRFQRKTRGYLAAFFIVSLLLASCTAGQANRTVRNQELAETLGAVTAAQFEINTGTGNLALNGLTGGEPLLAGGSLEYLEGQGQPERSLTTNNDQVVLKWAASGVQPSGFRFPWEDDNGEVNWKVSLNPSVSYNLTAHSDGGNIKLNLAGLAITQVNADTDGGKIEVILPDRTANLGLTAKSGGGNVTVEIGSSITGSHTINASSGAGNVTVRLPEGTAARIRVTSGMGNANVASHFLKIDDKTYQSPDYESAADRVEITADSGAGDVTIETME